MSNRFGRVSAILRYAAVVATVLVSFGPTGSSPAAAATTWSDTVGSQSPDKSIQVLAYLPNSFAINVGDSMVWSFPADEPHTVSINPTNPNPRGPQVCNGGVPLITDQCTWNGTSAVSSGVKLGGGQYTITFTTVGTYTFLCLFHRQMTGTMNVRAAGTPYPDNSINYNAEGKRQEGSLLRRGSEVRGQQVAQGSILGKVGQVLIGSGFVTSTPGGAESVSINRFYPPTITVHVGQSVTWTANDPATPHTVTFGVEPAPPNPPAGLDGPGHATLSAPYPVQGVGLPTVSSGFLGQGQPFGTSFAATFTAPGTYRYYCALHDDLGMVGAVIVS